MNNLYVNKSGCVVDSETHENLVELISEEEFIIQKETGKYKMEFIDNEFHFKIKIIKK